MKLLIFSMAILAFGSASYGESNPKIFLEVHLTRFGSEVCKHAVIVEDGKSYLWCEGSFDKYRIQSKLQAEIQVDGSVLVKASIDQVSPSGEALNLSNPSIQTLYDKTAKISQLSSSGGDLLSLAITPRLR